MEKITTHMTQEYLYDFFLYHAYSKFAGFLSNILGLAVIFLGVFSYTSGRINGYLCAVYLIAAFGFLGYTPFTLKHRAKKAMEQMDIYKNPLDMTFDDENGIMIQQGDSSTMYGWERVKKAVVTPKTIALYIGDEEALIIPKVDFGDSFQPIYIMIARHLGMGNFRQR